MELNHNLQIIESLLDLETPSPNSLWVATKDDAAKYEILQAPKGPKNHPILYFRDVLSWSSYRSPLHPSPFNQTQLAQRDL